MTDSTIYDRMTDNRCCGCGAELDENGCGGVCKGCLHPERLEARIMSMPAGPMRDALMSIGRKFGSIPQA